MDARAISDALGGKRCGKGYIMPCVAHDDRNPSLSVSDGDAGKLLAYCHAGCTFEAIRSNLKEMGLWPGSCQRSNVSARRKSRFQLFNLLDFEMLVYRQILNSRLGDYEKMRDKQYRSDHPEFKPMPEEPWDREILASKRIRKIMGELYGR